MHQCTVGLGTLFSHHLKSASLVVARRGDVIGRRIDLGSMFHAISSDGRLHSVVTRHTRQFFTQCPGVVITNLTLLAMLPFMFLILLFIARRGVTVLAS